MNRNPFFSVVIPTYNCSSLLKKALSSVFEQTFQDFEVIVIDNSSTDDTHQMLKGIDDTRFSVIKVQNNGVIGYSRNVGIKKAKGKWIAFLDSDDVWLSEKLEVMYDAISKNDNIILFCHYEWKVIDGKRKSVRRYGPVSSDVYESLLFHKNCLSASAVTLLGDVAVKTGGFSERNDFRIVEDYEYWIRLSQEGEFCFLDRVLGESHVRKNSESKKKFELQADASIQVIEHHLAKWKEKHPDSERNVQKRLGRVWTSSGHKMLLGRNYSKAKRYALQSISLSPFYWKAWTLLLFSVIRVAI